MPVTQPAVDLTNCDRELIHLPGSIQPHGFLLALHPQTGRVHLASQSAAAHLERPLPQILHCDVLELFSEPLGDRLHQSLDREDLGASARYLFATRLPGTSHGLDFEVVAYRSGEHIVLEFEELKEAVDSETLNARLYDAITRAHSLRSVKAAVEMAAGELRRMTGFDRVLLYRFDEEGTGIVLAEDRNDRLPSYLDLRFPASDVPQQARRLYELNRVRIIPDVDYTPSPLVGEREGGEEEPPLDLSGSILRSVSPIHREYMRNMGTIASMSVSIMVEDRLWGLVSFHHSEPRLIPYRLRSACDLLVQIVSAQVEMHGKSEVLLRAIELKAVQRRLLTHMATEEHYLDGLTKHADDLLELVDARGAALVLGEECIPLGETPPRQEIAAFAQWLADRGERDSFVTDGLSREYPPAAAWSATASGVIALSISRVHRSYLLWFRPEVIRTVTWAGEPGKSVSREGSTIEIHPRHSFASWSETVRNRSRRWSQTEVDAAVELRSAILEIVLKRAEEMADLVTELEFANKELEAFSYSVSHDLRAPFRHISGFSELLLEEESEKLSERGKHYVQTIIQSARFAGLLVDTLLNFSRIARSHMEQVPVPMQQLVHEQWESVIAQEGGDRKIRFTMDTLPTVRGDLNLMRQVIRNLLSNAVKYTRPRPEAEVHFGVEDQGTEFVFCVRDNGIGFDQAYVHKLFGVFQRLHRVEEFEGTGIGLANIRRIVSRHGGRAWAEGRVGEGATFYFSMPSREFNGETTDA